MMFVSLSSRMQMDCRKHRVAVCLPLHILQQGGRRHVNGERHWKSQATIARFFVRHSVVADCVAGFGGRQRVVL